MNAINITLEEIRRAKEDEIVISDGKRKLAQIFKMGDGFAVQIPNKYIKDRVSAEWTTRIHDKEVKDGDIKSPEAEPKMSFHIEKELFVQISGKGVRSGRTKEGVAKGAGFIKKRLNLGHYDTQHIGHAGVVINSHLDNYKIVKPEELDKKILNICESEKIITFIFLADRKLTQEVFCEYIHKTIAGYVEKVPNELHGTSIPLKIDKYDSLFAVSLPWNEMPETPVFGSMTSISIDGSQLMLGIKRKTT